jgi:hypothetical protein
MQVEIKILSKNLRIGKQWLTLQTNTNNVERNLSYLSFRLGLAWPHDDAEVDKKKQRIKEILSKRE